MTRSRLFIVLASIISAVLVPVSFNLITTHGWSLLGLIGSVVGLFATLFSYRQAAFSPSAAEEKEQVAAQLIQTLAQMEQSARNVLQDRQYESRPLSLRQVQARRRELDIWTGEDTIGFDIARRARNAIVHGDLQDVDIVDLRYATEKTKQLLDKIQSSSNAEDK